jgi:integrative and conjugative element protein (TIGR02256 family)
MLARAGVEKLQLFDKGLVTPGILVRQDFDSEHVGYSKVSALKLSVEKINPGINVSSNFFDLISLFEDKEHLDDVLKADVIIDATASNTFSTAFEYFFRFNPINHSPVITMCLGHNADYGLVTLANDNCSGLSYDLDRRSKIEFANSISGKNFIEEFWPIAEKRRQFFQPEPGCSSPTFRGSFADILALTSQLLNVSADWLSNNSFATLQRTFAVNLSDKSSIALPKRQIQLEWPNYTLITDQNKGYEVRLEPSASNSILSWIRRSERVNGVKVETGGVLFGQIDEFLKVIWINEVSGPPSDSIASPNCFICGTEGVNEMNVEKNKRTTGTVTFIGMWHTHPQGRPIPSPTDLSAMKTLLGSKKDYLGKSFLMLIFGGTSSIPDVSANLYERKNYV